MSEAKYTKGPWVIHESNAIVGEKLDDHPIWLRPVIARFATGVRPEDARLMAAAPELLEALIELLSYAPGFYENDPRSDAEIDAGHDAAYKKARAAIAKALGE